MSLIINMKTSCKKLTAGFALPAAAFLVSMAIVCRVRGTWNVVALLPSTEIDVTSASGQTPWQRLRIQISKQSITWPDTSQSKRAILHHPEGHSAHPQGEARAQEGLHNDVEWTMQNIHQLLEKSDQPMSNMTLHFVWCGPERLFDYRNYLSIKSAIKITQPRRIIFHYQYLPMEDPYRYFTWFEQLRSEYSNMTLNQFNRSEDIFSNNFAQYALVFDILRQFGGLFVPEDSIVLKIPSRAKNMSFASGISSCNLKVFLKGMALARKGQHEIPLTEWDQVKMLSTCNQSDNPLRPCTVTDNFLHGRMWSPSCVRLTTPIHPRDLWASRDRLAAVARMIAYDKLELRPRQTMLANERTPRVAHYLCDRNCVISFTFFLSVLSALHVGLLDHVMIHGPTEPSGEWWERLQQQRGHVVRFVQRDLPHEDHPGQKSTNKMQRYVARTEILMQFGGVFHDSHVIWTQAIPDRLLEYEAVVSPDWRQYGSWPESVNHALTLASRSAEYLKQLLTVYHENADSKTPWVADRYLSYRLIELDPTLVLLAPQLQVKCLDQLCHPMWQTGHPSPGLQNVPGSRFDWRTDTLSVHWESGIDPPLDVDQIRFSAGMITEIAEHVLAAAGEDMNSYL